METGRIKSKVKKLLCTLSGDDWGIIAVCSNRTQNRFAAIGFFVLLIFALCFISGYFTFTKLFQSHLIGIPAGIFFSFMITNIYLLLLYTLTDNVLPHVRRKLGRLFSTGIRILFIWFIAIIVSKPIEMLIFSSWIDDDIATFKQEQLANFTTATEKYFENETQKLRKLIAEQKELYNELDDSRVRKYEQLIQKREAEKNQLISQMQGLVEHSNYYIRSILILNKGYPLCWLITIIVMIIFTIPARLKDLIPLTGIFYGRKRDIETELVKAEYRECKTKYASLFRTLHNTEYELSEPFEDAPFNLIRKMDDRKFLPEANLISDLYDA